jgi:hypothetical protein
MKIDAEALKSFNSEVDKTNFSKYPTNVWIAKDTKMIDQVGFTTTSDGTKVDLRLTITDYNKPVTVVKPTGAKSLLEIISLVLSSTGLGGDSSSLQDLGSGISL